MWNRIRHTGRNSFRLASVGLKPDLQEALEGDRSINLSLNSRSPTGQACLTPEFVFRRLKDRDVFVPGLHGRTCAQS